MSEDPKKVIQFARRTQGYLYKKSSGFLSIWQKRYFIIIDNTLSYFSDETLQEVKKNINLEQIKDVKVVDKTEFHLVTKKRIYQLQSDDVSTRDLWVGSLTILTNHKEWDQANSQKQIRATSKKELGVRKPSKMKKVASTSDSPRLHKQTSSASTKLKFIQNDFSADKFFNAILLPRLSQICKQQAIKNKIILLKQFKGCYFIVSCKTLLLSHEDQDFLSQQIITPYDFNTLYYFQFGQVENPGVLQICQCFEFSFVEAVSNKIRIELLDKTITINLEQRKNEVVDVQSIVKKLKSAAAISKEYHNKLQIKIKRNIDKLIYKHDAKELTMNEIAKKEVEKCISEVKQTNFKNEFRKILQNLKKSYKQIVNCCEVKQLLGKQFKDLFAKEFHQQINQYLHKTWGVISKMLTLPQIKKVLILLYDFWKMIKDDLKDDRLFQASISMQKILIDKYEDEIISKIDSCFDLSEKQLLDEVNIDIKSQDVVMNKMDNIFYSNSVYRQFHLDIRLVLYEFPQMPIHEKSLNYYLVLFHNTFKHISEKTFKYLDRWKDPFLILGTCNEIQFIKNSLFEEMLDRLTKEFKQLSHKIKNQNLKELENQINNIEIMLVKKLFVLTFSNIDRKLLNKSYQQLDIGIICQQIIDKLKSFTKINKYVKRNLFEASFQQICYFYYTNVIKFSNTEKRRPCQFFIKKVIEDIKKIGQFFEGFIYNQKIYTHLKDLSLLREFLQCDLNQVKKICSTLKKEFGNSFTETAFKNLLSFREMSEELKENIINECNEIIKNSADTPEEISLVSSSRESFLQNWNNTRSRKSTLTLSLNEFYQNQHVIHSNKYNCSKFKKGYLLKKKITKHLNTPEKRYYFQITNGQLIENQSDHVEEESTNVYELQFIKKCYLHPEKAYIFIIEFPQVKLQFKAETTDEAKEWIKNIYEEISSLNVVKENKTQKDRISCQSNVNSPQKEMKDLSTMESYPKNVKDRSLEKSGGSPPLKKSRKQDMVKGVDSPKKISKQERQRQIDQDNCLKCSKGFFF